MATVKQLLELALAQREYDIEIIEFGPDDYDPSMFTPMQGKLRFKIGNQVLGCIGTNADSNDPTDKNRDHVCWIAAAVLKELKYEIFRTYFILV